MSHLNSLCCKSIALSALPWPETVVDVPHTHKKIPQPHHASTGETPQPREGLAGFYRATDSSRCFLQVYAHSAHPKQTSGTSPGTASTHRWGRTIRQVQERLCLHTANSPLLSVSRKADTTSPHSLCQRGKRVSSKVGISVRVGSQAAQPPDIPSLRHSPLCHWS